MRLVYFAWVRERIGRAEEEVDPPPAVETVADLVAWLRGRGENYAQAFDNPGVIRAALDRMHVKPEASLRGAREAAIIPPINSG